MQKARSKNGLHVSGTFRGSGVAGDKKAVAEGQGRRRQ